MLKRMRELRDRRESFGFETTLAGKRHQVFIQRARDAGYEVHLIYVWLSSPELAIVRVAHRVRLGGHSVPDETVKRRYHRGLANFFDLYRPLATTWTLCDNSSTRIVMVAQGTSVGETEVYDAKALDRIERSAKNVRE